MGTDSSRSQRLDLRGRLRRPDGVTESVRWLFAILNSISLLLSVIDPLSTVRGVWLGQLLVSTVVLIGSSVAIYVSGRTPLGLDIVMAIAICDVAVLCRSPLLVLGYIFSLIWFVSLFGPLWRSILRCALYLGAVAAASRIAEQLFDREPSQSVPGLAFQLLPMMLVTVVVARQLGSGLTAREQSLLRDAVLTKTGSRLLAVTDPAQVRALAWTAAVDICAATPGLRLLRVFERRGSLQVEGACGVFLSVPSTLPLSMIDSPQRTTGAVVADTVLLDTAVGTRVPLEWACLDLAEPETVGWLLVGARRPVLAQALLSVRSLINLTVLADENVQVHAELTTQASLDSLTGLANRTAFTSALDAQVQDPTRRRELQVLFVDLDDFKDVNDEFGHLAGDEVLLEVASRMQSCVRSGDLCARLGGDEFAILLVDTAVPDAEILARRIVDRIARPMQLTGYSARVSVSIGVATFDPGIGLEELVHRADVAMYTAKAAGKGRLQVFEPGLRRAATDRRSLQQELLSAIARDELVAFYQPILSLPDLRCIAVEALIRWQHPTRGLLEPHTFLTAAAHGGSIIDVGRFVLREACTMLSTWSVEFPDVPLSMHANVTVPEIEHEDFVTFVMNCISQADIAPSRLVLEVAETAELRAPAVITHLQELVGRGVQVAIDDFGTGFSNLATLRPIPVHCLKLDRGFISGVTTDPTDRAIVEAIVQMSSRMGLATIAEGVERLDQERYLAGAGVTAVQGFLYQPPVPATTFVQWLRQNHASDPASAIDARPLGSPHHS